MTKADYAQLRRDPRWQKKRLEILERDGFRCLSCGSTDKELHVHHRYYVQDREPWNYPGWVLITLCIDCHEGCNNAVVDFWETALDRLAGDNPSQLMSQFIKVAGRLDDETVRALFGDFVLNLENHNATTIS